MLPGVFSPMLCLALRAHHAASEQRRSGFMYGDREIIREDVKQRVDALPDAELRWAAQNALIPHFDTIDRVFDLPFTQSDRCLVARYDAPGGHFEAHRDAVFPGTEHRRVAVSINLNDDFDGGELHLPECGMTVRAPAGALVLFSADTLHRVAPVTRGSRYAFLTFLY